MTETGLAEGRDQVHRRAGYGPAAVPVKRPASRQSHALLEADGGLALLTDQIFVTAAVSLSEDVRNSASHSWGLEAQARTGRRPGAGVIYPDYERQLSLIGRWRTTRSCGS